jgi:protein-tyrosine phosphatase
MVCPRVCCCCCGFTAGSNGDVCHACQKLFDQEFTSIMRRLHNIRPSFQVWSKKGTQPNKNKDIPAQPAIIWEANDNQLLLGDTDEWFNPECTLANVKTIVNLCPEHTWYDIYQMRAYELGAVVISLPALDSWDYDIVQEACFNEMLDLICHRLHIGSVLVACRAGCNRSVAVVLATLVLKYKVNIVDAFKTISDRRGRILTNYYFRQLLTMASLEAQSKSAAVQV